MNTPAHRCFARLSSFLMGTLEEIPSHLYTPPATEEPPVVVRPRCDIAVESTAAITGAVKFRVRKVSPGKYSVTVVSPTGVAHTLQSRDGGCQLFTRADAAARAIRARNPRAERFYKFTEELL